MTLLTSEKRRYLKSSESTQYRILSLMVLVYPVDMAIHFVFDILLDATHGHSYTLLTAISVPDPHFHVFNKASLSDTAMYQFEDRQ